MVDRKLLRLSATLVIIGDVVLTFVTLFVHPGGGATEEATFANYAASGGWATIHLVQFVCMAVLQAGLIVLFFALNVSEGAPRWVGFFGAIAAGIALALYGVEQAVDGVALKQAVDAWVSAPATEQAARFASAQAIRWLEWGSSSYQEFMFGLALVLYAIVIVWTARVPRPLGYLMGLSGLAFIISGWVFGTQGFTATIGGLSSATGYSLVLVSAIWLFIVAGRMKEPVQAAQKGGAT